MEYENDECIGLLVFNIMIDLLEQIYGEKAFMKFSKLIYAY